MKTGVIAVIVVILLGAGVWYYTTHMPTPTTGPNTGAGINGSPNQGNLGQPDNGTPQTPNDQGMSDNGVQPQGDGTGVSQNLILGLNTSAALGQYLSAYNGMTLYTYAPDKQSPGKSVCNGGCAAAWPPYTVSSVADIHVPATFSATKVSTITRDDGTLQVTYNSNPLYFYAKDAKPGDTTGQGVGGVWYVVKP